MERNLMVAGFGGQGVMTLGKFLAEATTARSSGAAPPTAMWSSPMTTSARRWVTAWTI